MANMIQLWACILVSVLKASVLVLAVDNISANESIRDGQSIASAGDKFEMGFFSPGRSTNRYLGIWYKKIGNGTVVWVANRDVPLEDKSGFLKLASNGNLFLINSTGGIIWASNSSGSFNSTPIARLFDTGNLVVKDRNDNNQEGFRWQSFDYPTDTYLPGMKLGYNKRTGDSWRLTCWKSEDDPAQGDVTFGLDPHGYPQFFLKIDSIDKFRLGPWNGVGFSGQHIRSMRNNSEFIVGIDQEEAYYKNKFLDGSIVIRTLVTQSGNMWWSWNDQTHNWFQMQTLPGDNCDTYKFCGENGRCTPTSFPLCDCLDNFVPKNKTNWDRLDWADGCVRRAPLNCQNGDEFVKYSGIKLPDTRHSWFDQKMTLDECKSVCSQNCSCTAYANLDIRNGGSGCLLWFDNLIDIRDSSEDEQYLYVRMASSQLDGLPSPAPGTISMTVSQSGSSKSTKKRRKIVISLTVITVVLLFGSIPILYFYSKKFKRRRLERNLLSEGSVRHSPQHGGTKKSDKKDVQLPIFHFRTIMKATNNFSKANKLGEGGFGSVYRGRLKEGQEIAVKRLSENSSQGFEEFKNEVTLIAKLQHRNLVKLLGCCVRGKEKVLIYEYMSNKSLDYYIFDQVRSRLLNWPKRFYIINGIARGLLYLHQDSRLRIIHRDLKASNILLDNDLNPKISDFGLARSFGGTETQANTKRVVGTYGYMSPEYAMDGLFSINSDAFSFGVLVLEIISGKRNWRFSHLDHQLNLLGHAWKLFKEDKLLELVDKSVEISSYTSQIVRSIHVSLLCVQKIPENRPNMSSVIMMMSSETVLPQPKEPGFFMEAISLSEVHSSTLENVLISSCNEMTTSLDVR